MQQFFKYLLTSFLILFCVISLPAQRRTYIRTIVIDAGHGGHDPGAIGLMAKEKNINLSIALKLGNLIQRNLKDVRVIYTRDRDRFVELYRRAEIANENRADLFISIHCNANKTKTLRGAETYIMGLHKSGANLSTAKLENASILLESDYQATYNGFDPNSDESYIIFSLNQNANLEQSTDLASAIQEQMEEKVGLNNRGVRQAGFIVLYKTTMPSVIVETGYLSNSTEEKFLISDKGQEYIASAIYKAFRQFKDKLENPAVSREPVAKNEPAQVESTRWNVRDHDSSQEKIIREKDPVRDYPIANIQEQKTVSSTSGELSFRVQIAVTTADIGAHSAKFSTFSNVKMYQHNGMYKYTVGDEPNLQAAVRLLDQVKRKGVKDAFIVIFRNNQRIPQEEANRLMGK
ncbi:MAG: N-acetylmuramoyl-L-alanine amidase [Bacteroidales bacterium]|nr:N-acetylmuramoyl-L-alanine amidase [Bacteroidales bacterium]